jgi:hypothetical protein
MAGVCLPGIVILRAFAGEIKEQGLNGLGTGRERCFHEAEEIAMQHWLFWDGE